MEQFNAFYHSTPEGRLPDRQAYVTETTKRLNREAMRLHFRHFVVWLSTTLVIAYVFYLGGFVIDGVIGGALQWTSVVLAMYLVLFIITGHRKVHSARAARLYWLLNDAEKARSAAVVPDDGLQA